MIFHYLCQIEKKVSTSISYAFCEQYGESQSAYLNVYNYDYSCANRKGVDKLVKILGKMANINTDYEYINHQRNTYHNVPLWVLINSITFGQISKMYSFLLPQVQSKVSCNFYHINERELNQYLKVLVLYRNVCAHNERLFSHTVYSEIPDTTLHRKLGIQEFLFFKKDLINLIERYLKSSKRITNEQLLDMMGFPINWKYITKYKL